MLGEMGLLAEAFAAQRTGERLLAGVRANVHVHRVLVLEALGANRAVVQRALLALTVGQRCGGLLVVCRRNAVLLLLLLMLIDAAAVAAATVVVAGRR